MTPTAQEADLRFPVGKFDWNASVNEADYPKLIAAIAETPTALRSAVAGLSRDQLETRSRPDGWTVKQVVHHRRKLRHPEHDRELNLGQMLGLYAWHGRHHVAHITALRKREGW